MIVSHKYKFVYVAAPRTGTTSAESMIKPLLGKGDFCNTMRGVEMEKHDAYERALLIYPQAKDYWSFGFLRNPWDQVASYYHWWHTHLFPYRKRMPFKEWVSDPERLKVVKSAYIVRGVDKVYRYEDFGSAWSEIFGRTGLPLDSLPRYNSERPGRGYKSMYDQESWGLVASSYAEEIKLGNYGRIRR